MKVKELIQRVRGRNPTADVFVLDEAHNDKLFVPLEVGKLGQVWAFDADPKDVVITVEADDA